MTTLKLLCDIGSGVMTLTLNRPDKLNAIDNDLSHQLLQALRTAGQDPNVRVVVLKGNGRAFCAGRDVSAAPTEQDLVLVQAVAQAVVNLPKPVVAAVHGWTVGAGLEWMLNADVVLAATSARFKLPEASLGVFVTGGLTATLAAYAGAARAKALMLLGEEFTAAQAHAWGLVWNVVSPDALEAESARVAEKLAALQPEVASRFKRALNGVGLHQFNRAIDIENEAQRALSAQNGFEPPPGEPMQTKHHWEQVYTTKPEHSVSWFQPHAHQSVQLIAQTGVPQHASVIDVGGGASTLVDDLLAEGYTHLTVLDLSEAALAASRTRLGAKAQGVAWLTGDITQVELPRHAYDVWHDRAVFHFLTTPQERQAYVAAVLRAVKPGGHVIVATFAEDGPDKCSGLPVMRYSPDGLHAEFGAPFILLQQAREEHHTPMGNVQQFIYCLCRKEVS